MKKKNKEFAKEIGERIKHALNWSKYEFNMTAKAKDIGINRVSLDRYIDGVAEPQASAIKAISVYTGISADYFLGLTDVPHKYSADSNAAARALGLSEESIQILYYSGIISIKKLKVKKYILLKDFRLESI